MHDRESRSSESEQHLEILEVAGVQLVGDDWGVRRLLAVQALPVHAVEERVRLRGNMMTVTMCTVIMLSSAPAQLLWLRAADRDLDSVAACGQCEY